MLEKIGQVIIQSIRKHKLLSVNQSNIAFQIECASDVVEYAVYVNSRFNNDDLVKRHKAALNVSADYKEIYTKLIKGMGTAAITRDNNTFLHGIPRSLDYAEKDLIEIDDKFINIFGDVKKFEDLKVVHGYALGYINLANMLACFYLDMLFYLDDVLAVKTYSNFPSYIIRFMKDKAELVGKFAALLSSRPSNETIMNDLNIIRNNGTDVFLTLDGKTLDKYADNRDYNPRAHLMLEGFTLNPILVVGTGWAILMRLKYERQKRLREWVSAKLAIIAARKDGMDPESPEYQKLEKIYQSYTDMLAEVDKKIAAYEEE